MKGYSDNLKLHRFIHKQPEKEIIGQFYWIEYQSFTDDSIRLYQVREDPIWKKYPMLYRFKLKGDVWIETDEKPSHDLLTKINPKYDILWITWLFWKLVTPDELKDLKIESLEAQEAFMMNI